MPVSFANLVEKTRTVEIDVHGGTINVSYDPSKLSPAYMAKAQATVDENNPYTLARLFCSVVTDWDVEGPLNCEGDAQYVAPNQTVPLDADHVAWIPGPVLTHIITKIGEDVAPKSQTPRGSSRR